MSLLSRSRAGGRASCLGLWPLLLLVFETGCDKRPESILQPIAAIEVHSDSTTVHRPFDVARIFVVGLPLTDTTYVATLLRQSNDSMSVLKLARTNDSTLALLVPNVAPATDYVLDIGFGGARGRTPFPIAPMIPIGDPSGYATSAFERQRADAAGYLERLSSLPFVPVGPDSAGLASDLAHVPGLVTEAEQLVLALPDDGKQIVAHWLANQTPTHGQNAVRSAPRHTSPLAYDPGATARWAQTLARELALVIAAIAAFTLAYFSVPVLLPVAALGVFMAVLSFNTEAITGFTQALIPDGNLSIEAAQTPSARNSAAIPGVGAVLSMRPDEPLPIRISADLRQLDSRDIGTSVMVDRVAGALRNFRNAIDAVRPLLPQRFQSQSASLLLEGVGRSSVVRENALTQNLRIENVEPAYVHLVLSSGGQPGTMALTADGPFQTIDVGFSFDLVFEEPHVRSIGQHFNAVLKGQPASLMPVGLGFQWDFLESDYDSSNVLTRTDTHHNLADSLFGGGCYRIVVWKANNPPHAAFTLCRSPSACLPGFDSCFPYPDQVGNYVNGFRLVSTDTMLHVPAGTLRCYHYQSTGSINGGPYDINWFLAPGIGIAHMEYWYYLAPYGKPYRGTVYDLQSYSVGSASHSGPSAVARRPASVRSELPKSLLVPASIPSRR